MYATITRRTPNHARQADTLRQAASDYFPQLQRAPGFRGFYLIAGEDGVNTALALWDDRASADAFQATVGAWSATLDQHGHRPVSRTGGEVLEHVPSQP